MPTLNSARPQIGAREFRRIQELLERLTGIRIGDNKMDMVAGRLSRRLKALGLDSYEAYWACLEAEGSSELVGFVEALTTNVTSFFREAHHFDFLRDTLIPRLMEQHKTDRRLRFWSAGCSIGAEPYTLAMVLRETIPLEASWDVKILATDIDGQVVNRAREGRYRSNEIGGLSRARLAKWFRAESDSEEHVVTDSLKELITFKPLNLQGAWPFKGPFDVIFCRNVVIYFPKEVQVRLFDRFADVLAPGGHQFIGHSESLLGVTDRFRLISNSIYERTA